MKKVSMKVMTAALTVALAAGSLVGCAAKTEENKSTTPAASNSTKIEGTITATGSTALQPLAQEVAKMFKDKNSDATVNVQGGGSGTGLNDVSAGNAEIGNSDLFAEEKLDAEKAKALADHQVCVVGIAAVVNANVKVDNLTKQQLIDIFTGKITNWKQVNGPDKAIVLISRPDSSGTKATFKKYALDGNKEAAGQALKEDASGTVAKAVIETDGAIGYLASSFLVSADNKKGMNVLKIDGVEMNKDNITSGKYNVWAYEHMYTKGQATGVAKAFIEYFNDTAVKAVIEKLGYIPGSDMKAKH